MKKTMILLLLAVPVLYGEDLSAIRRISATTPADVQIALAKAAGPNVSDDATIYVLGAHGYRVATKGSNGFVCLVERQHVDTIEPECYDAEGAATILHARLFIEEQRAKGVPDAKINAAVEEGYKSGRFKAPRRAGIVYMMSDYNYVFDPSSARVIHFPGHLMFYAPYLTAKDVGSGPGAPYLVNPGHADNVMVVIPAKSHAH
jgi:hypothetical protein